VGGQVGGWVARVPATCGQPAHSYEGQPYGQECPRYVGGRVFQPWLQLWGFGSPCALLLVLVGHVQVSLRGEEASQGSQRVLIACHRHS
jgi:hypothetical protein